MLTEGFTVIDYQATPSGYYQISFRSTDGRAITATQHGRGGCNMYSPFFMLEEFKTWLDSNAQIAVDEYTAMGFDDLAQTVRDRGLEWYDMVVTAICDGIDMRKIRVGG